MAVAILEFIGFFKIQFCSCCLFYLNAFYIEKILLRFVLNRKKWDEQYTQRKKKKKTNKIEEFTKSKCIQRYQYRFFGSSPLPSFEVLDFFHYFLSAVMFKCRIFARMAELMFV